MAWQDAREGHYDLWLEATGRRVMEFAIQSWKSMSLLAKITAIGSLVGVILGTIAGFTPAVSAWDEMGLPTAATRAWVRDDNGQLKQLVSALNAKQTDLQLDNVNGKIEAITAARNKLEIDALSYDQVAKIRATQEIRRLDETIAALNDQKRAIRSPRGPH